MTKITVYYYEEYCGATHCNTHIAAVIEDEKNQKTVVVDYSKESIGKTFTSHTEFDGAKAKIILESKIPIGGFQGLYASRFDEEEFGCMSKNCSDAVNLALNHFFPETSAAQCWFTTKKLVCCLPGIAFLGAGCVPAPLFITTPKSVFAKATSISKSKTNLLEESLLSSSQPEPAPPRGSIMK